MSHDVPAEAPFPLEATGGFFISGSPGQIPNPRPERGGRAFHPNGPPVSFRAALQPGSARPRADSLVSGTYREFLHNQARTHSAGQGCDIGASGPTIRTHCRHPILSGPHHGLQDRRKPSIQQDQELRGERRYHYIRIELPCARRHGCRNCRIRSLQEG